MSTPTITPDSLDDDFEAFQRENADMKPAESADWLDFYLNRMIKPIPDPNPTAWENRTDQFDY